MKRFLFLAMAAVFMVSCLGDAYYESNETPIITFSNFPDGGEGNLPADSLFFGFQIGHFQTSYFAFMNSHSWDETENSMSEKPVEATDLEGGFGASSRLVRWNIPDLPKPEEKATADEGEETPEPEYKNDNLYMSLFRPVDKEKPAPNSYAVFYSNPRETEDKELMPEHDIVFLQPGGGTCTPKSLMIANTAFTIACATGYEGISEYTYDGAPYDTFKFEEYKGATGEEGSEATPGDYLSIVIKGYKNGSDAPTGEVTVYLVDYRESKKVLISDWTSVDLTKLGTIDYIDFDVECSVEGFPTYFCMDNFTSGVHVKF